MSNAESNKRHVDTVLGRLGYQARHTKCEYFRITRREAEALVAEVARLQGVSS